MSNAWLKPLLFVCFMDPPTITRVPSFVKLKEWNIMFWMQMKGKYICGGSTVRKSICLQCFDSFVNAEDVVASQRRLTACVLFSALWNTKAFNPHKLGTQDFNRTLLRMSLFSNTVMITTHPVRKYSSFSGCETISCSFYSPRMT